MLTPLESILSLSNTHLLTVPVQFGFKTTLEDDRAGLESAEVMELVNHEKVFMPLQGFGSTSDVSRESIARRAAGKTVVFKDPDGKVRKEVYVPSGAYVKDDVHLL